MDAQYGQQRKCAKLDAVRGTLEEISRTTPFPFQPRQNHTVQEYRALSISHFFEQINMGTPKIAQFYTDTKYEDKIEKKCTNIKLY